jgi:hypothetical protein
VLSCEQGQDRRGLQLRLYLSGIGPLAPQGAENLKDDPSVEFVIDDVRHSVQLLFADDFVVVADSADGVTPLLSDTLLDALQEGQRMELRFQALPLRSRKSGPSGYFTSCAERGGASTSAKSPRQTALRIVPPKT